MKHKLLSILLCLAMALSLLPTAALAEEAGTTGTIEVGETTYGSFSDAVNAATPDESGVITYKISGKVDVSSTGTAWIQVLKDGLNGVVKVVFVGKTDDAEISLTNPTSVLADQKYDIDVSFEKLTLSHPNGQWVGDLGHATNYFTCVLRNTNAAGNTVTYTNCTFPNGVCNNQYGKTVFTDCKFENTSSGLSNLWNYGGETKVENCTFTGTRGIKMYNEGTLETPPSIEIKNTSFTGMTEKAAIVVSKAANVTLDTVDATDCTKGLLQKDIEGSTDEQKITIEANGTGISGDFNITANKEPGVAKNEFNISGGEFTSEVKQDYCKDAFEVKAGADGKYTVEQSTNVAKVGDTGYTSLADALAALNKTNHTLTLIDGSQWDAATPVYYNGTFYANMDAAVEAANTANTTEPARIYCRPGASITGGHTNLKTSVTIFGNGASMASSWEPTVENNGYHTLEKAVQHTIYNLGKAGFWGGRLSDYQVDLTMIDCKDAHEIVINTGSGKGTTNITVKGCTFDGTKSSGSASIYSKFGGTVTIEDCEFKNVPVPVNINVKTDADTTVKISGSTFTSCGSATDKGEDKRSQYAAPIRVVNGGSGTMTANVSDCSFTDTIGNHGDILIGDGRNGKTSNDVTLTVTNTAANVQAQQPGYYDKNGAVAAAGKVSKTTVKKSESKTIKLEGSKDFKLAEVNGVQLSSLTDALDNARNSNKPIKLLSADTALVQAILDGQYGSIDGLTIELPTGDYGQLELGRATKYEGSNTVWYNGQWSQESGWTRVTPAVNAVSGLTDSVIHFYERTISDVTLKAAKDATVNVAGVKMSSGHVYGSTTSPVYDYVLDKQITDNGGYYLTHKVSNIAFEGLTFTAASNIATSQLETVISGFTFKNCKFNLGYSGTTYNGAYVALRYYNENNNGNVNTLLVEGCEFKNCSQGIYTQKIKNITVKGCTFDTTAHNAIAIQSAEEAVNHGTVIITGNRFNNIGAEAIRFGKVGADTQITITGNTAANIASGKKAVRAETLADGITYNISNNNWGTNVSHNQFKDTAAPGSGSGSSGYYVSTPSKTEHGSVTVSPRYADKGDTVTITVKPDSGYVLETLTVTDSKGNELKLTDKGDGKYTFTMPSGKVEVKATFMEDNSVLNFFYDVPNGAYFYEAVKWAVGKGITDGVGNNLFAPEQPCTRAQIVTFLWRAAGSPAPKGAASGMTDVVSGSYYEKAVAWAIENGITTGTTASTFSPDATCTRAQAVTFLARALNAKAASAAEFSDVPTDSYFAEAVAWAAANGVTEGIGGGLFGSDNDCTRGQIVTFLYRAYNK